MLILEFESHRRGEFFFIFFCQIKERGQSSAGSACDVTWLGATRGGKKGLNRSRDKNARHQPYVVGRGEKSLLCDPESEL